MERLTKDERMVKTASIFFSVFITGLGFGVLISNIPAAFGQSLIAEPIDDNFKDLTDGEKLVTIATDTRELQQMVARSSVSVTIGATEYAIGDEALIHAKVFELVASESVNDAHCDYNVFFPNRSLFTAGGLDNIPLSRGIYSDNFTVPQVTGVYPVDVECVRPFNGTIQPHHLTLKGADRRFINSTGTGTQTLTISNIEIDSGIVCFSPRFSESTQDFSNGEFQSIRFLDNITDTKMYFQNSQPTSTWSFIINLIKRGTNGEAQIGSMVNQSVSVPNTPTLVSFPTTQVDFPFEEDSLLEIEFCVRKLTGAASDISLFFNSSSADSSLVVNSLTVAAPVDFRVGGSSELAVTTIGFGQTQNINASLDALINELPVVIDTFEKLSNHNVCISNTTLQHNITFKIGNSPEKNVYQNEECPFGCDLENNRCNPSPFDALIWYVVPFIVFLIVIILVALKLLRG